MGGFATSVAGGALLGGVLGAASGKLAEDCGESFSADTKVQMADGSAKPISQVKPGDKVKSTDTASGKTKDSTATDVWVNHDTDLYDLTVHTAKGDQVIHTTRHHMYFDRSTHTWVEASKLKPGEELTTDDGSAVTVAGGVVPRSPAVTCGT